jgi:hypothetical protein
MYKYSAYESLGFKAIPKFGIPFFSLASSYFFCSLIFLSSSLISFNFYSAFFFSTNLLRRAILSALRLAAISVTDRSGEELFDTPEFFLSPGPDVDSMLRVLVLNG